MSAVCSDAAVLSAVKIKVPARTHRPNRKNLSADAIFEKCQISADISALAIYRSITSHFHLFFFVAEQVGLAENKPHYVDTPT